MNIKIEIEITPEEFQELFIPSEKQTEFLTMTYDAYTKAFQQLVQRQIDPHGMIWKRDAE